MIYWFSGTGNSKYVAGELSERLNERLEFIPDSNKICNLSDNERLLFVFPIYSWGVPPIVLDFIDKMTLNGYQNQYVGMVCTCGDETAKAPEMFVRAMQKKGISVTGIFSIIMPNNYVLLPGFGTDTKEVEEKKIQLALNRIETVANKILRGEQCTDVVRGSLASLKTNAIYPLFKHWGVFPKKWRYTDKCIGCGKCKKVCPVKNITLNSNRHPQWGNNCTSCVACYHICPVNAIQYARFTEGKGQYFFKYTQHKKKINL